MNSTAAPETHELRDIIDDAFVPYDDDELPHLNPVAIPAGNAINLFDPALAREAYAALPAHDDGDPATKPARMKRKLIHALIGHRYGHRREVATATSATVAALENLEHEQPHFANAIGIVRRAALSSLQNGTPMTFPHLLIIGPPGTGKTQVIRKIANALALPGTFIDLSSLDDTAALTGKSANWKSPGPSKIAKALARNDTASIVLQLDEIDKASQGTESSDPLKHFHQLLEPETSHEWVDQFLDIPLNASHILVLATANERSDIPRSILDRFTVIEAAIESEADHERIQRSVTDGVALKLGIPVGSLERAAVIALRNHTPRTQRKILHIAIGFAATRGSRIPDNNDVLRAARIVQAEGSRRKIGF